jgi:LacI family transcriptional regulator
MADILDRYAIPSVWLNVKRDHDCVHPDDFGAAVMGTEHLLGLGHRRVGYVTYDRITHKHYSNADRCDGYTHVMTRAGLTADVMCYPINYGNARRDALLTTWLERPDRPTAVMTYSSAEANAVYIAAARLGLSVPDDLSIMTVVEQNAGSDGAELDSVRLPTETVGVKAVEMLTRKIAAPRRRLPPLALAASLDAEKGRSTARLQKEA